MSYCLFGCLIHSTAKEWFLSRLSLPMSMHFYLTLSLLWKHSALILSLCTFPSQTVFRGLQCSENQVLHRNYLISPGIFMWDQSMIPKKAE